MIRHLLKLVWRRKRVNALLMIEIFFSFLVVFATVTAGLFLWNNYRRPLGYDYEDVWDVRIDVKQTTDDDWSERHVDLFAGLLREVRSFPDVVEAAGASDVPYDGSTSNYGMDLEGRTVHVQASEVTDGFAGVLGLEVTAGRWFEETDRAGAWEPLVINGRLAEMLFGDEVPIGKPTRFRFNERESRVVGVIAEYRKDGELSSPVPFLLRRVRVGEADSRPPRNLLLKMRAGVDPALEQRIADRLQAVARDYSFEVRILEEMRASRLRLTLAPLLAGGVVAGFLLIMVGLGLIGVLWQNVTQRTREIGLRRAAGASGAGVRRQILGELLLLTTLGLGLGVALLVQLPVLDLVGFLPPAVFTGGIVVACALIYALAAVSGLYPSWLATRVHPAEALHYE